MTALQAYKIFMPFLMIFLHILDDFVLQSMCLSNLKQRSWWKKFAPQTSYRYDYMIALIIHAFSWTFMMQLPILLLMYLEHRWNLILVYMCMFLTNWFLHSSVDNAKANKQKLNLWQDQLIHLVQIIITYVIFML